MHDRTATQADRPLPKPAEVLHATFPPWARVATPNYRRPAASGCSGRCTAQAKTRGPNAGKHSGNIPPLIPQAPDSATVRLCASWRFTSGGARR